MPEQDRAARRTAVSQSYPVSAEERDFKYTDARAVKWILIYVLLALTPLLLAVIAPLPESRTFWVEFGVALGFVGMGMMCLQFLFSGRFNWIAPHFGNDNVLQFHRQTGIVGVVLVLLHPAVLMLADPGFTAYFDPRVNFLRAVFLSIVTVSLILVVVTTLWREGLRLEYEWWRLVHGLLSLAIVFIGVVHGLQVGHYLGVFWKQAVWVLLAGASMYLVVHTRIVRPWKSRREPYRIVHVKEERNAATTLELEPENHLIMPYRPGQFAWMTVGETPFSLQQHPFSFASSHLQPRIAFTAKALGDFTSTWRDIPVGTRVYLEGPFGAFIMNPSPRTGAFFVVGGIGVTPAMSMMRTLRRSGDMREAVLIYANPTWEDVVFREEIDEIVEHTNVRVVHVLEKPPENWKGESGLLTKELLAKYLPPNKNEFEYFICGPGPMMNIAEENLRELGVTWKRLFTERFEIV